MNPAERMAEIRAAAIKRAQASIAQCRVSDAVRLIGDHIAKLNREEAIALAEYLGGLDPPSAVVALVAAGPSGGGSAAYAEAGS